MLAFDLPGGWTSPNLLLRFLTLGNNPWQPLRAGFTHRVTGERVKLAWSPASDPLAAAFAADLDRRIDAALLDEILEHRAVVTLSIDASTDGDPIARAITLARAADAIVNAGALAVRCRCSGLAHGADAFQARVTAVDAAAGATDASALHEALLEVYVDIPPRPGRPSTVGMQALGLPDVELARAGDPDLDRERLWRGARDLLRGPVPPSRPDDRGHPATMTNPYGLVPAPVQTPPPF